MTTLDPYPWIALSSSIVLVVLSAIHLRAVVRGYRADRDAWGSSRVVTALTYLVASVGLVISSGSVFIGSATPGVVGLAFVRGAMLIGITTLVLTDRYRKPE